MTFPVIIAESEPVLAPPAQLNQASANSGPDAVGEPGAGNAVAVGVWDVALTADLALDGSVDEVGSDAVGWDGDVLASVVGAAGEALRAPEAGADVGVGVGVEIAVLVLALGLGAAAVLLSEPSEAVAALVAAVAADAVA